MEKIVFKNIPEYYSKDIYYIENKLDDLRLSYEKMTRNSYKYDKSEHAIISKIESVIYHIEYKVIEILNNNYQSNDDILNPFENLKNMLEETLNSVLLIENQIN